MYGLRNSELSTCLLVCFNSVIKRVKQCCCRLILLPKSTINANLTTTNRFFTNDDGQRGRFENFKSDHQYESNLESDVGPYDSNSNRITKLRRSLITLVSNYTNALGSVDKKVTDIKAT